MYFFWTGGRVYVGVEGVYAHTHTMHVGSPGVGIRRPEGLKNRDEINLGTYVFVNVYEVHCDMYICARRRDKILDTTPIHMDLNYIHPYSRVLNCRLKRSKQLSSSFLINHFRRWWLACDQPAMTFRNQRDCLLLRFKLRWGVLGLPQLVTSEGYVSGYEIVLPHPVPLHVPNIGISHREENTWGKYTCKTVMSYWPLERFEDVTNHFMSSIFYISNWSMLLLLLRKK